MAKKTDIIGAGVAGILGNGVRPAAGGEAVRDRASGGGYYPGRGRPRSDESHFGAGKTFVYSSVSFESEQYRQVRELARERRVSIKEMIYVLINEGLKKVAK